MATRRIGPFEVESVGLGCMSLSHAYGTPPDAEHGRRLLNRALDIGYDYYRCSYLLCKQHIGNIVFCNIDL